MIAGPNGAGKTTFARAHLPKTARILQFINADLIAGGLAPLAPRLATVAAARLMLTEMRRLAAARVDFAFESTLSGVGHVRHIQAWRRQGIESKSCIFGWPRQRLRYSASALGSGRAAMTFRRQM